jgi:hypothetical protein
MITSPVFRHSKPATLEIFALVPATTVSFTDQVFFDSLEVEEMNYGMFDVIRDGVTLSRERTLSPDYWFEGGFLRTSESGAYTLRVYNDIMPFEKCVVPIGKKIIQSDGNLFKVGVPFWPQILAQPEFGIARVSNDGRNIAFCSQGTVGQAAFSYRLMNAFGQVSEPACIYVTAARV